MNSLNKFINQVNFSNKFSFVRYLIYLFFIFLLPFYYTEKITKNQFLTVQIVLVFYTIVDCLCLVISQYLKRNDDQRRYSTDKLVKQLVSAMFILFC